MLLIFLVNMLGSFFWKRKKGIRSTNAFFLKKSYVSLHVQQIRYELIKEMNFTKDQWVHGYKTM